MCLFILENMLTTNKAGSGAKSSTECYLGLLYAMDDFAVYGYITPLRVKIVLTIALTDALVRDADVTMACRPLILLMCGKLIDLPDFPCFTHGILSCAHEPVPPTRRAVRRDCGPHRPFGPEQDAVERIQKTSGRRCTGLRRECTL